MLVKDEGLWVKIGFGLLLPLSHVFGVTHRRSIKMNHWAISRRAEYLTLEHPGLMSHIRRYYHQGSVKLLRASLLLALVSLTVCCTASSPVVARATTVLAPTAAR